MANRPDPNPIPMKDGKLFLFTIIALTLFMIGYGIYSVYSENHHLGAHTPSTQPIQQPQTKTSPNTADNHKSPPQSNTTTTQPSKQLPQQPSSTTNPNAKVPVSPKGAITRPTHAKPCDDSYYQQQAEKWFAHDIDNPFTATSAGKSTTVKEHQLSISGEDFQITVDGKGTIVVDGQESKLNGYRSVFPKEKCEIKIVGSVRIRFWQGKGKISFSKDSYIESDGHALISLEESKPAIKLAADAYYKAVRLEELIVKDDYIKLFADHCGTINVVGNHAQIFLYHCQTVNAKDYARVQAHCCTNVNASDHAHVTYTNCYSVTADTTCTITQQ